MVLLAIAMVVMMGDAMATPAYMEAYGAPGCPSCHSDGIFDKAAGQAGLAAYLASLTTICTAPQILQNNVCVTPAPGTTLASAENGRLLSSACAECHGIYGISNNGANGYPNINGQDVTYFFSALQQYKNGQRSNETMRGLISSLSDQDIFDLAAYYAENKAMPSYSTETAVLNIPFAQTLSEYYQVNMAQLPDGNFSVTTANRLGAPVAGSAVASAENGRILSSACSACHGRYGIGNNDDTHTYPNINGQKEAYFFNALQEYKNGLRSNESMQAQIGPLSDQNMRDLAAYYTGNDTAPTFSLETRILNIPLVQILSEYYQVTMTQLSDGKFSVTTANRLE